MTRDSMHAMAGFSLIETLVAFAVLSLAFAILLPLLRDSGYFSSEAADTRLAILVAQSRFAEVGRERPLTPGEWTGQDSNGYSWRIEIRQDPLLPKDNEYRLAAYDVTVTVAPPGRSITQGIRLNTIRLGP